MSFDSSPARLRHSLLRLTYSVAPTPIPSQLETTAERVQQRRQARTVVVAARVAMEVAMEPRLVVTQVAAQLPDPARAQDHDHAGQRREAEEGRDKSPIP